MVTIIATLALRVPVGMVLGRNALQELSDTPPGPAGRGIVGRSVAPAAVEARPDQAVALAVLVVEQVGEDRGGEARIVELEA